MSKEKNVRNDTLSYMTVAVAQEEREEEEDGGRMEEREREREREKNVDEEEEEEEEEGVSPVVIQLSHRAVVDAEKKNILQHKKGNNEKKEKTQIK